MTALDSILEVGVVRCASRDNCFFHLLLSSSLQLMPLEQSLLLNAGRLKKEEELLRNNDRE
jgi:hypothetical protein